MKPIPTNEAIRSGNVHVHQLANGLTLLMERMPRLRSAAFTFMLPAGTSDEPPHLQGLAGIVLEMMQRGAGERTSRQLVESLDFIGVERDSGIATLHSSMSAAMIDEYLFETLSIFADIILRPHFPLDQLEDSRSTALQELAALQDDAVQRCFIRLRECRYGNVYGRNASGSEDGIESIELKDIQEFYQQYFHPSGSILSIAGNIEFDATIEKIEHLFGTWTSTSHKTLPSIPANRATSHIDEETSQTQIAIAYDAVPYDDEKYYESRALINILGDGMSSRLFTEVREKRGLAYSVSASPQSIGTRSSTVIYAGTTSARADETLDVILSTVQSLQTGISEDELRRLKARVKTSLVFEQESCNARASQNATDWFYLNRIVDRSEVFAKVDRLNTSVLLQHANNFPMKNVTLVTLGERPLKVSHAI